MKINDLLTPQASIMEGVIKLPPKLLAKVKNEFFSVVCSYARARCGEAGEFMLKNDDITSGGLAYAFRQFDSFFKAKYPDVKFTDFNTKQKTTSRKVGDFDDDDLDPRYRKAMEKSKLNVYYHWNKDDRKPLKLVLTLKPEGGMKGFAGQYSSNANHVEINLEKLKGFAWDEFLEFAQAAYDDNDDIERRKMLRMLNTLDDRFVRIEGTLEHEMTHYIQFKVFGGVSDKQIAADGKSNPADDLHVQNSSKYYTSQVEFDPQIKSHAKSIIVTIRANKRTKGMEGLTWKDVALVAVGEKKAKDVIKDKQLPSWTMLADEEKFFAYLKKVDKEKWKKAVKLFMQTVGAAFEGEK